MRAAAAIVLAGAALAGSACAGAAAAPSLDRAVLDADGLGPVRIGMTVTEARAATSTRLAFGQRSGECAVLSKPRYDGVFFIATAGIIRRASVEAGPPRLARVRTSKGVRITSRERLVRRRYGRPFFSAPDLYSGGPELVYRPRPVLAPRRRIVFVTGPRGPGGARYVTQLSVGDVPEVRYPEACS